MRRSLSFLLAFSLALIALPAVAQVVIATIPVGNGPTGAVVDRVTNQIYIINQTDATVMDIDGATNQVIYTVSVGPVPDASGINTVTNKGYFASSYVNGGNNWVTVVDLPTGNTSNVTVGVFPSSVAVNSTTNRIYVANKCGSDPSCQSNGTVSVIDGTSNSVIDTITAGLYSRAVAVNQVTNRVYVSNGNSNNMTVIDGSTDTVIDTITGLNQPGGGIAINSLTNTIYVGNPGSNYVTVIDGATDNTTNVTVGNNPGGVQADPVTNMIFVVNKNDDTVSVIDGASNTVVQTVPVGTTPDGPNVDTPTNKIYVANAGNNTVMMIDGVTYATTTVNVGTQPEGASVNGVTNRIYVPNYGSNNVSVIAGASAAPLQFVSVTPCRLVDTRNGSPIQGGASQSFILPQLGNCGIPATAAAYSLNVTVVPITTLGYLTIWPTGENQPVASTLNSPDGRIKANAAIVPAGYQGAVSVYVTDTTNVILDIDGYYAPPASNTYQFYPLTPCRLVDTRGADGELGGPRLQAQTPRDFPLLQSTCIPSGLQPLAYSLNFTVVPNPGGQPLGYLTVWPVGEPQPTVSTLNNPTATVVANAAIVPAGTNGDINVYAYNTTDLLIDINGYFAAPGTGGFSMYPVAPCRVLDTRQSGGSFVDEKTVNVGGSACAPPSNAAAYIFNATVLPPGSMPYLTLWPDGSQQPVVSTLNAYDGFITSNMAIVPTSNGSIDAYAYALTQLILDISGYFAP
ncbi:MAG: hypothetical protein ACLPPV_09480 [Candidatus Korobacteraceae bacterium]